MLTVNAPVSKMFFTVLWLSLRHIVICAESLMPPHAAFIASGFPCASYDPTISTGCGYRYGFAPKFFLMMVPPSQRIKFVAIFASCSGSP